MSVILEINGQDFAYPEVNDNDWGADATDWAVAVTSGMLQKAGGLFLLLADVDFGANFGLKSIYYKSRATSPSQSGVLRLANTELVTWRNFADGADLSLGVNTSNQLTFEGSAIQAAFTVLDTATIDLTFAAQVLSADVKALSITNALVATSAAIAYSKLALTGSIVNADVNASAAIAYSKLALTGSIVNADVNTSAAIAYSKLALTGSVVNADINASAAIAVSKLAALTVSRAVVTDGSGLLAAATTTATEIGYVNGVTSSIQTQLGTKLTTGTGALVNADVNASAAIALTKLAATTVSRALVSDGSGFVSAATTTSTEIGYVNGVTSSIQTQLNAKQATGSYITALTGDGTAAGPGSSALTFATVNANVGSFGSSTSIPTFTVNGKGLITAASGNVVIAPAGTLSGTTLNATVVTSSLTSVGTIATGVWNGTAIAIANGGTGQTTANTALNALLPSQGSASGKFLVSDGTNTSWTSQAAAPSSSYEYVNGSIASSVATNALTVALKDGGGSDASAGSAVKIGFRNATAATGTYSEVSVTGALSLTVASGATLGTVNTLTHYLYVYVINNAGTAELAISQSVFDEGTIQNTTALSGSSNSNAVLYSTVARTGVAIRLIARLKVSETTAGTWATAASELSNIPFVNQTVCVKYENTAGTSVTSTPGTIPFATRIYDTHGAFNGSTGVFTAPVDGKYHVSVQLYSAAVNQSVTQGMDCRFLVTSTPEGLSAATQSGPVIFGAGSSRICVPGASRSYNLVAGNTIAITSASDVTVALSTTSGRNIICIERVGNL